MSRRMPMPAHSGDDQLLLSMARGLKAAIAGMSPYPALELIRGDLEAILRRARGRVEGLERKTAANGHWEDRER